MPYQNLQSYFEQVNLKNYQLFEMSGDDHIYDDLEQLQDSIVSYVKT